MNFFLLPTAANFKQLLLFTPHTTNNNHHYWRRTCVPSQRQEPNCFVAFLSFCLSFRSFVFLLTHLVDKDLAVPLSPEL